MKEVSDFLEEKIRQKLFSACAVFAGNQKTILSESYRGTISSDSEIKVVAKTYFDLQSITKSVVTSPLVHVLARNGLITLNDKVIGNVTIRDLLLHQSGLSDKDLDITFKNPFEAWSKIFRVKPGRKCIEYADLNYRILGRFLELRMGASLQDLARNYIWSPLGITGFTYIPFDTFNTTGVSRSHGRIDDDGVFEIGSVVGDDGVFGTAEALAKFLSAVHQERGPLKGYVKFLNDFAIAKDPSGDFYESLRYGSKNTGWEINDFPVSYAGPVGTSLTIEKSGGAGTFIWLDLATGNYLVYLTNHGKPEPFKRKSWNKLVENLAPDELSEIIFH